MENKTYRREEMRCDERIGEERKGKERGAQLIASKEFPAV